MVPMTVVFIVHDFTVINLTEQPDLPEDNSAVTSHAETITMSCADHLFFSEEAVGDDASAEMTVGAEVA